MNLCRNTSINSSISNFLKMISIRDALLVHHCSIHWSLNKLSIALRRGCSDNSEACVACTIIHGCSDNSEACAACTMNTFVQTRQRDRFSCSSFCEHGIYLYIGLRTVDQPNNRDTNQYRPWSCFMFFTSRNTSILRNTTRCKQKKEQRAAPTKCCTEGGAAAILVTRQ